jgi:tetratricopeptide (TPR) repeat protein
MAKKTSTGKTIFKIACATGGAVLASGVGLPWLGAMAGSCLPKVLEGSLGFLVSAVEDDKKQEVLASLLQKPIEQLASLGIEFTGGRIDDFFKSHFEAKESELNFDLPRAVVKVWEEALNKMLRVKRDDSILGLNRNDEFEKTRKELLTFWRQKLLKAQSDNDLLKEFFGEKPDYFLDVEKGKVSFIEALPDQEQVESFFWNRIEDSFTNWAKNKEKFPEDWTNSIHQTLKDELKQKLFHNFSSALKKELKENERAWKSFEFASSLQTVSMLQSLASNTDQIKNDTSNIKKDLAELNNVLPLIMRDILTRFDALENTVKEFFTSNQNINGLLIDFRKEVNEKLDRIEDYAKQAAENTEKLLKQSNGKELSSSEEPKIPDDIQVLIDEGFNLRYDGKYEEATTVTQQAKELAIKYDNRLAVAEVNRFLAVILNERDRDTNGAVALLNECLKEFRSLKAEKYVAKTLLYLGVIGVENGDIDLSTAYLSQALDLAKKHEMKLLVATALHQLGWLEHRRGHSKQALDLYDQSINSFLSLYHNGDPKTEKDAVHGVALCYHHRGLIYEHLGNDEVEANFMLALEWNRKSEAKSEIAKILWLIAKLKFRENEYEEATKFLEEAIGIYSEIEDCSWLARCLDLKARLHYTQRQPDKAIAVFEIALATVEKNSDYREQVKYLEKLGRIHAETKNLEKAKNYFEKAKDLSLREDFLESYAEAVESLAKVAHVEKNLKERNRLLLDGIQTLEKLLRSVQIEPRRAFITGRIGFFYERLEDFPQALIYYQRAKKAFETYSDIWGIANSLGSIARIKGFMKKRNEEFDAYSKVKTLVDGTHFYDLIAGSAINLGEINMEIGNLDEAKMLFQEAEFLCRKYNLHYADHLSRTISRLNKLISVRKLPELSFEQLLNELFRLVNWFPEAKDSLLRLWFSGRVETILGNFRSSLGIKFMLCQDNTKTFLQTSAILHSYSDLCLQVVSVEYQGSGLDIVPFPEDEDTFFEFSTGFGGVGISGRYYLTSDTAQSKITGNTGAVFTGWALGLPEQAHELILSRNADNLINQKIFFLPYSRHLFNDKLHNDLNFFGKEIGLIPVYFDSLPSSENLTVLHSAKIDLPILSAEDFQNQRRQIRKVKQVLTQLVSDKNSRQSALNDFVFEVEELKDSCESSESIQIQVYILEFPSGLEKETHIAFVIKN